MNKTRRNEIAFLLDVAEMRDPQANVWTLGPQAANELVEAITQLRVAEKNARYVSRVMCEHAAKVLGGQCPSEEELREYIDELVKTKEGQI
jgi:hypothetical protein